MLTPFAGLSVVWSLLFTSFLLPEVPVKEQYQSTLFITLGCLLISLSASHSSESFSVDDLIQLSMTPLNVAFSILYFIILSILLFVVFSHKEELAKAKGLACSLLSGVLSGNQTFIKCLSVILSDFLKGVPVWRSLWVYYYLVMVGITAGGGIIALNSALRQYEAMFVIPIYQGCFIIVGSLSGIIFFNEMASVTRGQILIYCIGIAMNLYGLFLTNKPKTKYA